MMARSAVDSLGLSLDQTPEPGIGSTQDKKWGRHRANGPPPDAEGLAFDASRRLAFLASVKSLPSVKLPKERRAPMEQQTGQVEELVEEWLSGYHKRNTRRAYKVDVREFLEWCEGEGLGLREVQRKHGNAFLSYLIDLGRTGTTVGRKLAAAKMFCEYLYCEEYLDRNPLHFVRFRYQQGEGRTTWLPEAEFRALLATATTTNAPLRDFMLCALLGLNGLRINEVRTARVERLEMTGGIQTLWVTRKGGKKTRVPLDPRIAAVLDEYLAWLGNPKRGWLMVSITREGQPKMPLRPVEKVSVGRRLKKLAAEAGINTDISPHSLRRSFATLALGKGWPLHYVQAAMGHSNPTTTMRYNKDADNLDNNPTFLLADMLFGEKLERKVLEPTPIVPALDAGSIALEAAPASLGERIRRLRLERNWSQGMLAERIGPLTAANQVSSWETGKVQPAVRTLERLALALEVPLDELTGGAS